MNELEEEAGDRNLYPETIVKNILGKGKKIIKCPYCFGDGLDENMKTCKYCDGTGEKR